MMSDPFASLLSSFKSEDRSSSPRHDKSASLNDLLIRNNASSPIQNASISHGNLQSTSSSVINNREITPESFDGAFQNTYSGLLDGFQSPAPTPVVQESGSLIDLEDITATSDTPFQNNALFTDPHSEIDEAKDYELARIMSLGVPIEQASLYYNRGMLCEDVKMILEQGRELPVSPERSSTYSIGSPGIGPSDGNATSFFNIASNFLNKGRSFVEEQLSRTVQGVEGISTQANIFPTSRYHPNSASLNTHHSVMIDEAVSELDNLKISTHNTGGQNIPANDDLLNDDYTVDNPLPVVSRASSPTSIPDICSRDDSNVLLDFDMHSEPNHGPAGNTSHNMVISDLELTSYNEFNEKGRKSFQAGDYHAAYEQFLKSLNALPLLYPLRIIALSNMITAQAKLGGETLALKYAEEASKIIERVNVDDFIQNSNPPKTYRNIWSKILIKEAEILQDMDNYAGALQKYQLLMTYGVINKKVLEGKARCQKVLNPAPTKPKQSSTSTTNSKPPIPAVSKTLLGSTAVNKSLPGMRQEEDEERRFQLSCKVEKQIKNWVENRDNDIRFLLANLSKVLKWTDWTPVSANDLVIPKKVKVVYLKAMTKTHPDKIRSSLDMESQMLAEHVFAVLAKAWEIFKKENKMV